MRMRYKSCGLKDIWIWKTSVAQQQHQGFTTKAVNWFVLWTCIHNSQIAWICGCGGWTGFGSWCVKKFGRKWMVHRVHWYTACVYIDNQIWVAHIWFRWIPCKYNFYLVLAMGSGHQKQTTTPHEFDFRVICGGNTKQQQRRNADNFPKKNISSAHPDYFVWNWLFFFFGCHFITHEQRLSLVVYCLRVFCWFWHHPTE